MTPPPKRPKPSTEENRWWLACHAILRLAAGDTPELWPMGARLDRL
jgi:hypothetical protein